jgi:hypothetical protein
MLAAILRASARSLMSSRRVAEHVDETAASRGALSPVLLHRLPQHGSRAIRS